MRSVRFCIPFLLLCFTACKEDREIKVYRVVKETQPASQPADPHAGIPGMSPSPSMPEGSAGGDPHAGLSAAQMASVSSGSGPQVSDSPPANWKKQAPTAMRQLSYLIEGEKGTVADVSLIVLRGAAGGTLANVNRWRGQLGLPPIDEAGLKGGSQTVSTPTGAAVVVELEGLAPGADPSKDGRMLGAIADRAGDAWFFKMRGNSALVAAEKAHFLEWITTVKPAEPSSAAPSAPPQPNPPAASDNLLTWEAPSGWARSPASSSMRYATFTVTAADGSKGEIAVTHFGGDVGGDLENVNRWRQQVNLPPVDAAGLTSLITKITAGPKTLSLIDVTGPKARLAAGWTRHGPDTWFFKFTGPDALVASEKEKFTAFLTSIRFTQSE